MPIKYTCLSCGFDTARMNFSVGADKTIFVCDNCRSEQYYDSQLEEWVTLAQDV